MNHVANAGTFIHLLLVAHSRQLSRSHHIGQAAEKLQLSGNSQLTTRVLYVLAYYPLRVVSSPFLQLLNPFGVFFVFISKKILSCIISIISLCFFGKELDLLHQRTIEMKGTDVWTGGSVHPERCAYEGVAAARDAVVIGRKIGRS